MPGSVYFCLMTQLVKIRKPEIFSFKECLWYLDRGYDDCLFTITEGELVKGLEIAGVKVLFKVKEEGEWLVLQVLNDKVTDGQLVLLKVHVEDWFDLHVDLVPFYSLLQQREFSYMTEKFWGLRLVGIEDLFEAISWSIIGQQINLNFA